MIEMIGDPQSKIQNRSRVGFVEASHDWVWGIRILDLDCGLVDDQDD